MAWLPSHLERPLSTSFSVLKGLPSNPSFPRTPQHPSVGLSAPRGLHPVGAAGLPLISSVVPHCTCLGHLKGAWQCEWAGSGTSECPAAALVQVPRLQDQPCSATWTHWHPQNQQAEQGHGPLYSLLCEGQSEPSSPCAHPQPQAVSLPQPSRPADLPVSLPLEQVCCQKELSGVALGEARRLPGRLLPCGVGTRAPAHRARPGSLPGCS